MFICMFQFVNRYYILQKKNYDDITIEGKCQNNLVVSFILFLPLVYMFWNVFSFSLYYLRWLLELSISPFFTHILHDYELDCTINCVVHIY